MSSKTKIVVLHMKEVIYTAIFLVLAVLTVVLLFIMFGSNRGSDDGTSVSEADVPKYVAGVYTTSIELNDNTFDVQVTVDSNHINSISLVNLSDSATAMYPLMEPALESLAEQIYDTQSTDNISFDEENKYTSMLLLEAIKTALSKAVPQK
ncbi:MAG: hypothetical protein ACOX8E_03815 [Ruminococcus sp.]|jgi:uncharacterized protein with FMN-binding domain